jgi:hypothetical protein
MGEEPMAGYVYGTSKTGDALRRALEDQSELLAPGQRLVTDKTLNNALAQSGAAAGGLDSHEQEVLRDAYTGFKVPNQVRLVANGSAGNIIQTLLSPDVGLNASEGPVTEPSQSPTPRPGGFSIQGATGNPPSYQCYRLSITFYREGDRTDVVLKGDLRWLGEGPIPITLIMDDPRLPTVPVTIQPEYLVYENELSQSGLVTSVAADTLADVAQKIQEAIQREFPNHGFEFTPGLSGPNTLEFSVSRKPARKPEPGAYPEAEPIEIPTQEQPETEPSADADPPMKCFSGETEVDCDTFFSN